MCIRAVVELGIWETENDLSEILHDDEKTKLLRRRGESETIFTNAFIVII